VPKSRIRRRFVFTPPQERSATRIESPRWVAVLFVSLMVIGLLWLVTFYVVNAADANVPLISDLRNWNLAVGFAFIGLGFAIATKWR
jgi:predicted PurR-regulated permease PerM